MVYSRATTSEMAERDFLPEVFVCLGVVEGLSFAIAAGVAIAAWEEGEEGLMLSLNECAPIEAACATFWISRLRRNFTVGVSRDVVSSDFNWSYDTVS
jgi:hypothetical protein